LNRWYKSAKVLSLTCILLFAVNPVFSSQETALLNSIKKHSRENNSKSVNSLSRKFLKKFPRSRHVPDVRLIIAENENDPVKAIKKYRIVIRNYRYFKKNDYAQYRICEIYDLLSKWKELKKESALGITRYKKSSYTTKFRFYNIIACINLNLYSEAERECRYIIENDHYYKNLSKALFVLSYINKKKSGYSRSYIYSLREVILGFDESESYVSTLYLLGEFYDKNEERDKAYSVYSDVLNKFPRSPEACNAGRKLRDLEKYHPKRVKYYPDQKIIDNTDPIDISPDIIIEDKKNNRVYYSISIGPFKSFDRAKNIKSLLTGYGPVKTIRLKKGFIHFLGKHPSTERALQMKIRLAEEYGINGNIVRVALNDRNKYIYGE